MAMDWVFSYTFYFGELEMFTDNSYEVRVFDECCLCIKSHEYVREGASIVQPVSAVAV